MGTWGILSKPEASTIPELQSLHELRGFGAPGFQAEGLWSSGKIGRVSGMGTWGILSKPEASTIPELQSLHELLEAWQT